jgi:excisionase family DNA binding protein
MTNRLTPGCGASAVRERDTIDVADVAQRLGLSTASVYAACRQGTLPAVRVGQRWLVLRRQFEELLRLEASAT